MTYITFVIVGIFFCLNLPRILVGAYEVSNTWTILKCAENNFDYHESLLFYKWDTISRLLMVLNSSINFLIYCAGSEQFKVKNELIWKNAFVHPHNLFSSSFRMSSQKFSWNRVSLKTILSKFQSLPTKMAIMLSKL